MESGATSRLPFTAAGTLAGPRQFIAVLLSTFVSVALSLSAHAASAPLPEHLHDTGLFEADSLRIRSENLGFTPQYPLWSDGASKQRWIYLPPGSQIDASNPDAWDFPRGTKLWKEFRHGRAIETRYLERLSDGTWQFASYVWNEAGTDAVLAPVDGIRQLPAASAPDGVYSVPARADCLACHDGGASPVLGFSALQLSPDRDPLAVHGEQPRSGDIDLTALAASGLIRNLPVELVQHAPRIAANTPVERAALGYLHGNCGHCHNAAGPLAALDMVFAQSVTGSSAALPLQQYLIGIASEFRPQGRVLNRVQPGNRSASVVAIRMGTRNLIEQMPPLGTRLIDEQGVALIAQWIDQLSQRIPPHTLANH